MKRNKIRSIKWSWDSDGTMAERKPWHFAPRLSHSTRMLSIEAARIASGDLSMSRFFFFSISFIRLRMHPTPSFLHSSQPISFALRVIIKVCSITKMKYLSVIRTVTFEKKKKKGQRKRLYWCGCYIYCT